MTSTAAKDAASSPVQQGSRSAQSLEAYPPAAASWPGMLVPTSGHCTLAYSQVCDLLASADRVRISCTPQGSLDSAGALKQALLQANALLGLQCSADGSALTFEINVEGPVLVASRGASSTTLLQNLQKSHVCFCALAAFPSSPFVDDLTVVASGCRSSQASNGSSM